MNEKTYLVLLMGFMVLAIIFYTAYIVVDMKLYLWLSIASNLGQVLSIIIFLIKNKKTKL